MNCLKIGKYPEKFTLAYQKIKNAMNNSNDAAKCYKCFLSYIY